MIEYLKFIIFIDHFRRNDDHSWSTDSVRPNNLRKQRESWFERGEISWDLLKRGIVCKLVILLCWSLETGALWSAACSAGDVSKVLRSQTKSEVNCWHKPWASWSIPRFMINRILNARDNYAALDRNLIIGFVSASARLPSATQRNPRLIHELW